MNDGSRTARVNCDSKGDPVGCAIFLTGGQLCELGLDPETIERIEYVVTDGDLQLQEQYSPDEQQTYTSYGTVDESRGEATDD